VRWRRQAALRLAALGLFLKELACLAPHRHKKLTDNWRALQKAADDANGDEAAFVAALAAARVAAMTREWDAAAQHLLPVQPPSSSARQLLAAGAACFLLADLSFFLAGLSLQAAKPSPPSPEPGQREDPAADPLFQWLDLCVGFWWPRLERQTQQLWRRLPAGGFDTWHGASERLARRCLLLLEPDPKFGC
jgi:hypothetical protein